ncbi:MAG: PorT family protein [Muribaculaceae bacterium]|nr:PorT family protein [Muribaculaceae bacterium]
MKIIKTLIAAVALMVGTTSANAGGLFKIGPRVGLTVNEMHFNKSVVDDNNRTGWTAGLMTEFRVPVIGIGADLSLMYVRRNNSFMVQNNLTKNDRDYFEIPLNLRYNISLPVVNNFITPYLAVGPSVSFLTSRRNIEEAYRNKSVDWALNFGFGVQLIRHLDISARYGLGLTKAVRTATGNNTAAGIQGKNRYWTISAAYLF